MSNLRCYCWTFLTLFLILSPYIHGNNDYFYFSCFTLYFFVQISNKYIMLQPDASLHDSNWRSGILVCILR